jgi:heme oxygenase
MSLKELTSDSHRRAEATAFMKSVFKKAMPDDVWADYTFNKMLWYGAIEIKARSERLLDDLPDIDRAYKLYQDYMEMTNKEFKHKFRPDAIAYHRYILDLEPGKVLAHLYTWHMGDLFGGQMIKKMLPGSHRNLEFKDVETLKTNLRSKLDNSMADEANIAFDWAIKIMESYHGDLGSNDSSE